ncbi:MAG: SMC-Scp complex subunit ScpB [bacterium]|nr:SMC-Scp complex subunit ScpB [bacterium]
MSTESHIEGLLFWKAEPTPITKLAKLLGISVKEIAESLDRLEERLQGRGVVLVRAGDMVELRVSGEASDFITRLSKEEMSRDLGKAGLETLAVVLYRGPISRREIDYIRGVNSAFILRNLAVRDLIERIPNPENDRSFLYRPTIELLSHLGIQRVEDLPEYGKVKEDFASFFKETEAERESADSSE